jgi:hypothetical protein
MTDKEPDDEFPEFKPEDLEFPEIDPEDLKFPEIDPEDLKFLEIDPDALFTKELAEATAMRAENEAQAKRWVDSGFKLGGHLLPSDKKLLDNWILGTLKAAAADALAASSRVEEMMRLVSYNQANIRRYKDWEKRSRKRSKSGRLAATIGPMLMHLPEGTRPS